MSRYMDYMLCFSQSDLRGYLGQNMIDLLIEWMPDGDMLLTKQKMVSMINSLYGTAILKEKKFRKNLLECMNVKDIVLIRDECLTGTESNETDPVKIIEIVANKPWKRNRVSEYLAKIWEISDSIFDKEKDDTIVENIIESSKEQFYELLDYQYYIKQRVLNNLNSGNLQERMLVHMPTGTGKTKTSMHIIANYINFSLKKQGVVIWIADTIELLQQAYETFVSVWVHLGNGSISAYKLWGNKNIEGLEKPLTGIVFCGLAKLLSIANNNKQLYERLKKDCRLVVFDEAHKAAAPQTQKIIEELMLMPKGYENRALIGLTATPGRTTEDSYDNNLLTNMFGNKLIYIDSDILNQINYGKLKALNTVAEKNIIRYFQERRILAKMIPQRLTYKTSFSEKDLEILRKALRDIGYDEKDYTAEQLKVLATNKERNLAIIKQLRTLHIENKPTIVFACSVNHAKLLSAMLTLEEIKNSLVLGEMNEIDRKHAIEAFKDRKSEVNIIINYGVLTTGFDSKNIRCVFITRPTKSIVLYSQMLGRGLRGPLMGGNEECTLIDIDDNLQIFNNETAFSHFNDYWRV